MSSGVKRRAGCVQQVRVRCGGVAAVLWRCEAGVGTALQLRWAGVGAAWGRREGGMGAAWWGREGAGGVSTGCYGVGAV